MSREQRLVEQVVATSLVANPNYTHEQHLAWSLGLLAHVVLRKNYMDSIVYTELAQVLNELNNTNKYTSRSY